MVSSARGSSWIHSKIIAFLTVGLTKTPKIEFLPLDWIYCSIRILMVTLKHANSNHLIYLHSIKYSTTCALCTGDWEWWWLSSCCSLVIAQTKFPELDSWWLWPFTFLYFLITSESLYFRHGERCLALYRL